MRQRTAIRMAALTVAVGAAWAASGLGAAVPPDEALLDPAARYAAVAEIMQGRTQAVIDKDLEAWLADVDPGKPEWVDQQRVVFENLMALPLSRFGFEVVPSEFAVAGLEERYQRPAFVAAVVLRYQYDAVDAAPTARPQGITFVLRNDRWRIAADSDATDQLPPGSEAEPWLRVPVAVHREGSVLILTDREDPAAPELLATANEAAARVQEIAPAQWSGQLVVYAVSDARMLTTFLDPRRGQRLEWTKAAALPTYQEVDAWTDQAPSSPSGSRIVLNSTARVGGEADRLRLLTHEGLHAATHGLVGDGAPIWLVEGFAEWAAYRDAPQTRPPDADLDIALADTAYPAAIPGNGRFFLGNQTLNYTVSWLMCRYLAEQYGEVALQRFFVRLAPTADVADTMSEQQAAFVEVLGLTEAEFLSDLRAWMREQA